jgi:outer membrane protein OmpA-like peptidoglycan-associated protein
MRVLLIIIFTCKNNFSFAQNNKLSIYFDFNKSEIKISNKLVLDSFINSYVGNNQSISLFGHTDSKGSNAYNISLSKKRVLSVRRYLIEHHFSESLIIKEAAFGESRLLLQDDENEVKGKPNRRVEIIFTENIILDTKEKTIKEIIEDTATKKGAILTLKNIQFQAGTHFILNTAMPKLKNLLESLQANKNLKISIEGHICCIPQKEDSYDPNTGTQDLSNQRAKSIYDYLVKAGIEPSRLQYRGFGHSMPIYLYPEKNEAEEIANRRVEIKIIDK